MVKNTLNTRIQVCSLDVHPVFVALFEYASIYHCFFPQTLFNPLLTPVAAPDVRRGDVQCSHTRLVVMHTGVNTGFSMSWHQILEYMNPVGQRSSVFIDSYQARSCCTIVISFVQWHHGELLSANPAGPVGGSEARLQHERHTAGHEHDTPHQYLHVFHPVRNSRSGEFGLFSIFTGCAIVI